MPVVSVIKVPLPVCRPLNAVWPASFKHLPHRGAAVFHSAGRARGLLAAEHDRANRGGVGGHRCGNEKSGTHAKCESDAESLLVVSCAHRVLTVVVRQALASHDAQADSGRGERQHRRLGDGDSVGDEDAR